MILDFQVAELAVQGVERGLFFSKSPDFISNVAIASLAGVAPRIFNVAIEFMLLPFYFFLHLWIRWNIDRRILAWRAETQDQHKGDTAILPSSTSLWNFWCNSCTACCRPDISSQKTDDLKLRFS